MATVAVLLEGAGFGRPLSPLFGRARWLVCIDQDSGREVWMDNRHRGAVATAGVLLRCGVERLACTWVQADSLRLLRTAGVDVRLAPVTMPASAALACIDSLPVACEHDCDSLMG